MPNVDELRAQQEQLRQEAEALRGPYSGALVSAAQGASNALFGPISALEQDPLVLEQMRRNQEQHQVASMAGNLAGYIGGALGGIGLPGILTGVSKGAAGLTAKALGGSALAKGAGFVAGSALEGGGIALSEATAESAIDRTLGVPGAGLEIAHASGTGAAMGAGFGLLAMALPKVGNFLFRQGFKGRIAQVDKAKAARLEAGKEYDALVKELDAIEAAGPLNYERFRRHEEILGKMGGRVIRETPVRGGKSFITEPVEGMKEPLLQSAKKSMQRADEGIQKALNGALEDVGEATRYGGIDLIADGALWAASGPVAVLLRHHMAPTLRMIQGKVFQGITNLKPIRYLMSSSLQAGKLSATKYIRQGAEFVPDPNWGYGKYVNAGKTIASSLKVPPIRVMSEQEVDEISDEILQNDPAKMEQSVRLALAAKGVPQEAAGPIVQQNLRVFNHITSRMPQVHQPKWIAKERPPKISASSARRFSEALRVSFMPIVAPVDFLEGKLSEETAIGWWATQPELAEFLAERISNYVNIAIAHGRKFTADEKKQIGLIVDPQGAMVGRSRSYSLVQMLQSNYQAEQQQTPPPQVGGPKPPGDPKAFAGASKAFVSPSGGLTGRLTGR